MGKKFLKVIFAVLVLLPVTVSAQYYQTGQTPASQRWMELRTDSLRMIYPREFESKARETMFYMDAARPYIGYGFKHGPLKAPVIFKTENLYSNGLGMLAPKRIEMVGTPAKDTYSTPWLKQLAVHEYRHMVQYANINRHTVKVLSWIFGEQLSLVATGLLPFWFIEGDATMTETQFSEYGRGLQPSFTMHYRALGREILEKRNPDKWFSGSYKDYVPSHYDLGYQMVSYSHRQYGPGMWNYITEYSSKYPFLIFTTQLGMKKYAGIYSKQLFRETFEELNTHWESLSDVKDSAEALTAAPKDYTTYSYPIFIDGNTIVALKNDLHRPSRFVRVDVRTGAEEHMAFTGSVSSRPAYRDGKLWWSEYRQSMLWEQRTFSYIYYMDVESGRIERFDGPDTAFYPTPTPSGELAYVEYNRDGTYTYINGEKTFDFGAAYSIHGLTWDDNSNWPYLITLGDEGMSIICLVGGKGRLQAFPETMPYHITIGDLRWHKDKLYFSSIQSGKDEAHMIDLAEGHLEYRLTDSRYGSFSPAPSPDGSKVAVTTYSRKGYGISIQHVSPGLQTETLVTQTELPVNLVNTPLPQWNVINIDDITFKKEDAQDSQQDNKSKRFRRLPHMFKVHSWAPLYFEPDNIINGTDFNIKLGATLVSQSLLGDAVSSLSYGYTANNHSLVRAKVNYLGSIPKFDVTAIWSNEPQRVYKPDDVTIPMPDKIKDYIKVSARAYLPMLLTNGYFSSRLTPSVEYMYVNNLQWDPNNEEYIKSNNYGVVSLQYTGNVRYAQLDLYPRWGYAIRANIVGRPWDNRFGQTIDLYGRIYLPGIVRHHGLSIAASWQEALNKSKYSYNSSALVPRGYTMPSTMKYAGASATYALPLAYPDWGWSGIFFLKRIWLTAGFDFAAFIPAGMNPSLSLKNGKKIWSYGGTLNLDVALFRLPSQGTTTLTVSCFKTKDKKAPSVSVGFSVPL